MSFILGAAWTFIYTSALAFWPWIVGIATAVLAFLFSPTIRKYTVAALAIGILLGLSALWGYNLPHKTQVVTHQCTEFTKHLKIDTKGVNTMKRYGLCL